jgi:hypothetical protein
VSSDLREALDAFTPPADDESPDWGEVLRRAGLAATPPPSLNGHAATNGELRPKPRRRRGLPALAVACVALGGLGLAFSPAGPAIARTLGDFTDWVTGEPGDPAPAAEQAAFAQATRSWKGFPPGTELRQLIRTTAGGQPVALYGFRGADALCIRLDVGAKKRDELTCPPLSELRTRAEPALVVVADHGIGATTRPASGPIRFPEPAARVTYGIVADGVDRVEVRRNDGTTSDALVSGDAFLDVDTKPDANRWVSRIWAWSDGRRVAVPFVPEQLMFGFRTFPTTTRKPRGPATLERKIHGGTIAWLAHREPRGTPVSPRTRRLNGIPPDAFARTVTPDPSAPERMIVSARDLVCATVVRGRYDGGGCWQPKRMFSTAPFVHGLSESGQYATLAGLASDDVARLVLFTSTGRQVPVRIHDNAFLVEAARTAYPLRLVGYDAAGRVIGVTTTGARGIPTPARRPAPGATWSVVLRNATGEVWVIRAVPSDTCSAFRIASGGATLGCPTPLTPRRMQVGVMRSSDPPTRVLNGRTGSAIVRVVVSYEGGGRQVVHPRRGYVLAKLRSSGVVDSIAGVDASGRRVALSSEGRSAVAAGSATIRSITPRWIALGPSKATAAELEAQGRDPHVTTCRRTKASPPLDGYRAGVHVQYICRGRVLHLIGRASTGTRWQDRTIWGRGRITAISRSSLTIRNELARANGGRPAPLGCTFTPTSPPAAGYRRGQQVEVFCLRGKLTGLNRAR